MSMAKKMAERTSGIQVDPTRRANSATDNSPVTSTGRLLDVQLRVNEAIERADAAETRASEAEAKRDEIEAALADARQQLEALANSASALAEDVEISSLVEVEGRRRILSAEEYEELRANLAATPLVHPIVYMLRPDGKKEVISGNNRVRIYRDDLKRERIKGVPFQGTQSEAELGAAFSNLLAPALPDFEKYRQFLRMQELSGLSQTDIIRVSGLSQGHVARIFSFTNLPDRAKELIAQRPHRLGGNAAQKFAMLAQNGNPEAVIEAIRKLVANDNLTQEQALSLATPKPPKAASEVITINKGKRKLCDISVRNGVIGLRFNGKEGQAVASEWSEKIADFIRSLVEAE
jgi:ParB family transcriptional regulator, chromosome partitioning protein